MTTDRSARDRMVHAAAQSVREHGVAGTSLRDVVDRANAPRGSLQHYFPGGKEQLITEALRWSGDFAASGVQRYLAGTAAPTPGGLFAAMARHWREELDRHGFRRGCPLLAAAADTAGSDPALREAVENAFEAWLSPVRTALRAMGVPTARSRSLATLMISSLEGAILLARTQQDAAPL